MKVITKVGYALIGIAILLAFGVVGGLENAVITFGQAIGGGVVVAIIAIVGRALIEEEGI